jgi:NitT/TauT family transport system substrate-binding protein
VNKRYLTPIAILATLFVTSAYGQQGKETTIRMAGNTNANNLPIWVALEKGFFAKKNLKVTWTSVPDTSTLPGTMGKTFDVAFFSATSLINAVNSGLPLTAVSGLVKLLGADTDCTIVASTKSGIKTPADLIGKTVGTPGLNGTADQTIRYGLSALGLDAKRVKFVQTSAGDAGGQLDAGRLDAALLVHPYSDIMIKQGYASVGTCFFPFASKPIASSALNATQEWANSNSEAVDQLRAALTEANEYIKADRAGALEVMEKYTRLSADKLKDATFPPFYSGITLESISMWIPVMKEQGGFVQKPTFDVNKLVFKPTP